MKKAFLMILDGWGIGDGGKDDVISITPTPELDKLYSKYPHSKLNASGEAVGLPDGQMGNSEVGHTNIGAGRVVYQDLVKINRACADNSIFSNKVLIDAMNYAKDNDVAVHFIGLLSDGCVHSSEQHLYALCEMTQRYNLQNVFIHAITDGRDTDPKSGAGYIQALDNQIKGTTVKIATVAGRYYTMDRDKRWDRVKKGYDAMVYGIGNKAKSAMEAIEESYNNDVTDEFVIPTVITTEEGNAVGTIKDKDVVVFYNFRNDRMKQIVGVMTQKGMPEEGLNKFDNLYCVTMVPYDEKFVNTHIVFDKEFVTDTLGEVVSKHGGKQIRIAETEKYAHVTFFFNGGVDTMFENERRILIDSPKVATYDLQPEMSAYLVKDAIIEELKKESAEFICLNFANGDMVGHTGVYDAIEKAVKVVDECVGEVVKTAVEHGYEMLIIADHGNADHAVNEDGSPNPAHSLNPVPCILISDRFNHISDGKLCDVAPTILTLMEIPIPKAMTGKCLI